MALKSKLASTDAATKAHLHKYQEGKEEVQVHYLAKKLIIAIYILPIGVEWLGSWNYQSTWEIGWPHNDRVLVVAHEHYWSEC